MDWIATLHMQACAQADKESSVWALKRSSAERGALTAL
jgi:hypothetical protein